MDKIEMIRQMLPQGLKKAIVFVFSSEKSFYLDGTLYLNDGDAEYRKEKYIHGGMFQDSVLIGTGDKWDFRFFPYTGNRLEFYMWDDGYGPAYAFNSGNELMEVDCPNGNFLIKPGALELLIENNTDVLTDKHIAPAINRHSIIDAHVDEKGMVWYGDK